jgi:hypothetical protein
MSVKSDARRVKRLAAIDAAKDQRKNMSAQSVAIGAWALSHNSNETRKFVRDSEGGVTIRLFGPIEGKGTGQVTMKLTKPEALALLAHPGQSEELDELVQQVLPFFECPIVMLSTNDL